MAICRWVLYNKRKTMTHIKKKPFIKRHNTQWEMAKQSAPLDSVAITFDVVKRLWNLGYQAEPVTGTDGWIKVFELPDPIYDSLAKEYITDYQS